MIELFRTFTLHLLLLYLAFLAVMLVHEGSHWLMAYAFKKRIKFTYSRAKLESKYITVNVPRFIWDMPEGLTKLQTQAIALAGFTGEIIVAVILFLFVDGDNDIRNFYIIISTLHLLLYNKYAGASNDFETAFKKTA